MKSNRTLIFISALLLWSCGPRETFVELSGEAQGTTYSIKYRNPTSDRVPDQVDSVFRQMDVLFSTYIMDSEISRFNLSQRGTRVSEDYSEVLETSWEVNIATDGMFDPTLAPVLKLYADARREQRIPDSTAIASALALTGLPLIKKEADSLIKRRPEVQLDLNGIAQGYTVDVICNVLEGHGIKDYMVEVGGEVRAHGTNKEGKYWIIGVDKPLENGNRELIAKIGLKDRAMATSGNYRKFMEIDGKKVGHIIDPKTGFPAQTALLSASVFSEKCSRADAYATAFMNMTETEVVDLVGRDTDLEVILISLIGKDTVIYVSPGLSEFVIP